MHRTRRSPMAASARSPMLATWLLPLLQSCALFGLPVGQPVGQPAAPPTPTVAATNGTPAAAVAATAEVALDGLDPVLLCRGEQFAGDARLSIHHEGYDYHFVDADSQASFLVEPARYAIQLGGACARMGTLSGPGAAQRWLVHDSHIYVFASDACRDGFAKDPARCLFAPVPPPGNGATAEVDALWQQAAAAHAVGFSTLRWATSKVDRDSTVTTRTTIAGDRALRVDTDYVQGNQVWRYARAVDGDAGWFVDNGTPRPMYHEANRTMQRELHREPLIALRHGLGTHSIRGERLEVAGVQVTEMLLWFDGEAVAFGVDDQQHVRTARYRGQRADLRFGEVVHRYDDLLEVGGVQIATTVHTWFDGVEQPDRCEHRSDVQVDTRLPEDWFAPPPLLQPTGS